MSIRVTFLGTSAGLPTIQRNVTSLALAKGDSRDWYMVDCGEATQHQLLKTRYCTSRLQMIFITHMHGDHIYGLPGLLASASMAGRTQPLTLCGPEGLEAYVVASLLGGDINELPFKLIFKRNDTSEFTFRDDDFVITAHELSHRVPSFAAQFREINHSSKLDTSKLQALGVPRGPLWGRLQQAESVTLDDGCTVSPQQVMQPPEKECIAIIGGDNDRPELLAEAMRDADLLVHEASFSKALRERIGPEYMHSTPEQVGIAAAEAGVGNLILTHFSGRYQKNPKQGEEGIETLRQEAANVYSGPIAMAEDFSCWEVKAGGEIEPVT
ncbi:MBL fold metallo-hydrolase [Spongorhabdus nitratireducens]